MCYLRKTWILKGTKQDSFQEDSSYLNQANSTHQFYSYFAVAHTEYSPTEKGMALQRILVEIASFSAQLFDLGQTIIRYQYAGC